jgi:hypothetical protein
LKTIAFFDVFNRPLAPLELWQFLSLSCSFEEVLAVLEEEPKIDCYQGVYFLSGRDEIVLNYKTTYQNSFSKYRRLLRISRIFAHVPFVKMIALGNMMGAHNLRKNGDLDLFIVAEAGHLWTVRFWTIGLAKIFARRPEKGKEKDSICLSFFY